MNATFDWDERFRLGDRRIDDQHLSLIALANAIPRAEGREAVEDAVMRAFRYTREHFDDEEEAMRRCRYPGLEEHRRLHEAIIEELGVRVAQGLPDEASLFEFRTFLYRWIVDHLMVHDRAFVAFAKGRASGTTGD